MKWMILRRKMTAVFHLFIYWLLVASLIRLDEWSAAPTKRHLSHWAQRQKMNDALTAWNPRLSNDDSGSSHIPGVSNQPVTPAAAASGTSHFAEWGVHHSRSAWWQSQWGTVVKLNGNGLKSMFFAPPRARGWGDPATDLQSGTSTLNHICSEKNK